MHLKLTDFESIVTSAQDLRRYLEENAGPLDGSSAAARDLARAEQSLAIHQAGKIPDGYDVAEGVLALANVAFLNRVVLSARGTPSESSILTRLKDLKKGVPGPLAPAVQSSQRDRTFELVCWHVCRQFTTDTVFQEPDIACRFQNDRWGLACKVTYGTPETTAGKVRGAMRQIDRADVNCGFVVVQLTNVFPHKAMYHEDPSTGVITSFHEVRALGDLMARLLIQVSDPIEEALNASHQAEPLVIGQKVRGILYVVHTLAHHQGRRAMMGCVRLTRCHRILLPSADQFIKQFNEGWQEV
jgi:hypothetical protein